MGLFGKKEEEFNEDSESDLEEEKRELREEIRFRRKLKDLKSGNRRKRKEPVKPWGKKERFLIAGVLLGTVIASGFLSLSARNFKLPGFPKLSLNISSLDLSNFNLFGEKVIKLGNSEKTDKSKRIIKSFEEKTNNLSGVYALYVIDLSDGFSFGVEEETLMQAASLIKLPVLGTLYKEAELGNIDLEEKYALKNSDKIAGSGSLQGKASGTILSFRDLARLMGQESDNTAFGIVRRRLGDEKINEFIKSAGMNRTDIGENTTTPKDIGIFFEGAWEARFVNEKSRDEILGFLTKTIYEAHLARGIPDVRVAHKFGREVHVVNDAGIVFSGKPFILVIMTEGIVEKEADEIFPILSKLVYDEMSK